MMAEIRGGPMLGEVLDGVIGGRREELLIGHAKPSAVGSWLLVVQSGRLARDDEVTRDQDGLHWTGDLTAQMYAEAERMDTGVVLIHAHGGQNHVPGLSPTDRRTAEEILSHFGMLLPERPHAYIVVNATHVSGFVQWGSNRRLIERLRVVSNPLRNWSSKAERRPAELQRDNRQAAALGAAGIARLRGATIALVGLGGAGSQVAEMLAHAGSGKLILADADVLEDVNLSRTHGATPRRLGQLKVRSARTMIKRVSPETRVTAIAELFPSRRLLRELRDVDVIVSCVDGVNARNELNRFALRYCVPLIDVGTTITPDPFRVDGHLTRAMPEAPCLRCAGHVSDAMLDENREAARRGVYGLEEGRPQVVSFNGLLASAATTEVLRLITGFGGKVIGSLELHYDPTRGELRSVELAAGRCRECDWYGRRADEA